MLKGLQISIFFVSLFHVTFALAQSDLKATVRAGKHPDYIRVVFVAPVDVLNKASVVLQGNNVIKVDLKPVTQLEVQPGGLLAENSTMELLRGLKISSRDNIFYVSYENIDDISVSKLANPPRLVIDIYSSTKKSTDEADSTVVKKEDKEPISTLSKVETLMIDAGHGGDDKGLVGQSYVEKDFALTFTKDLSNALNKSGKKTILTRRQDHTLTLKERYGIIKSKRFDLLMSIHVSSTEAMNVFTLNKGTVSKDSANTDIDYKSILSQFVRVLSGELKDFVSVQSPEIAPTMFIGMKKIGFLIELPNPNKFNYDRRGKERIISAIIKAVNAIE